ncbi:MAG: twin-arginine translocation signal domain-containing protein, partial [Flavobacteriaceae bacterium]
MERRRFLKASMFGGVAAAGTALAAPAIAQSSPTIRWRMPTHMPKFLPLLWAGGENFVKKVSDATDGKFQIQLSGPGEIVAPLQAYDAVTSGTVEMASTSMQYFYGKSPSFALMSAMAFGPNTRLTNAWMYEGGGLDVCNSILEKHKLMILLAGGAGEQMGGWFRKEVNTLEDLKGLRFRIPGIAG